MDTLIGVVPDDWRVHRLDECCDVQTGPSGTTLKSSDHTMQGVPLVKASDIEPDGISANPSASVSVATAQRLPRKYRLHPGDIVLVRIGTKTRHATVTERHDGWLLGGSCIRLRANRPTSPEYLTCYLTHPAVQEWLAEHTHRGVLATLTATTVRALPLVLPPAAVQQRVIAMFEIFNAKIRAHQEVIRITQTLQGLLLPRLLASGHSTGVSDVPV